MALEDLLGERPLVQAPMAGGASTPALVAAVAAAGGTGFLAAGYRTAEAVADQVRAVREGGTSAFGVNVFVPSPAVAAPGELRDLRAGLAPESRRYGAEPGEPLHDDDEWRAKIDLLCELAVPLVTFTFGCPDSAVLDRLRRAGSATMATVTTVEEARTAVERGADGVCVQGLEAGGHRASYDPRTGGDRPLSDLLPDVVAAVDVPVVAAGGLMTGDDVADALAAGARAAQLGTAFLRCPESGAQPAHKAALADPGFTETAVTWSFTGRPARGLVNRFIREHPGRHYAYPELHHMTRPLRSAAAAAGDPGGMALWAGQGFRAAEERPAGEVVARLRDEAAARGARI
ncbi:nitronate monooxygenase [Nocardiopsis sp. NRRL B-16309]|uniref:nitronate monooxygenase n=1 Tax=Nocardiopsis sp. NRRL B-16309 TaxID=1519494 RepID=UPI0006B022BE|nr:nitronate monooxygenase [Nocardiopsis sp. NRRL B-16309]KOX17023.1 2-nitropropane dioxygenase [Nocardiopsis sp. NRRL B-16309]